MNAQEKCPMCQSPVTIGGEGSTHWYASEFNEPNAQTIVAANVAARGYRDGWTAEQFVARQLAKLTEELAEGATGVLVSNPGYLPSWLSVLSDAGILARKAFDKRDVWRDIPFVNPDALRSELADMLVVLLAAAQALDFDVVQAAIDKSSADVARGVR